MAFGRRKLIEPTHEEKALVESKAQARLKCFREHLEILDNLIKQKQVESVEIESLVTSSEVSKKKLLELNLELEKANKEKADIEYKTTFKTNVQPWCIKRVGQPLLQDDKCVQKTLLDLMHELNSKFLLADFNGEFSSLRNNIVRISFPTNLWTRNNELDGQKAMSYLEGITGQKAGKNKVFTLTTTQCKEALTGLKLVNELTPEEVSMRKDGQRFQFKC